MLDRDGAKIGSCIERSRHGSLFVYHGFVVSTDFHRDSDDCDDNHSSAKPKLMVLCANDGYAGMVCLLYICWMQVVLYRGRSR